MRRSLSVLLVVTLLAAACGGGNESATSTGIEAVCALNEDFKALNEQTIPNMEEDPFPEPALLEENFVEGARLIRQMADAAPAEIASDLLVYAGWNENLSDLYAEYGYDREAVWEAEPYAEEHEMPEEARARIAEWFMERCGLDLQG